MDQTILILIQMIQFPSWKMEQPLVRARYVFYNELKHFLFYLLDYLPFNPKVAAAAGLPEELVSKAKQSRGEKKARKIMSKLGLKQVLC